MPPRPTHRHSVAHPYVPGSSSACVYDTLLNFSSSHSILNSLDGGIHSDQELLLLRQLWVQTQSVLCNSHVATELPNLSELQCLINKRGMIAALLGLNGKGVVSADHGTFPSHFPLCLDRRLGLRPPTWVPLCLCSPWPPGPCHPALISTHTHLPSPPGSLNRPSGVNRVVVIGK